MCRHITATIIPTIDFNLDKYIWADLCVCPCCENLLLQPYFKTISTLRLAARSLSSLLVLPGRGLAAPNPSIT